MNRRSTWGLGKGQILMKENLAPMQASLTTEETSEWAVTPLQLKGPDGFRTIAEGKEALQGATYDACPGAAH